MKDCAQHWLITSVIHSFFPLSCMLYGCNDTKFFIDQGIYFSVKYWSNCAENTLLIPPAHPFSTVPPRGSSVNTVYPLMAATIKQKNEVYGIRGHSWPRSASSLQLSSPNWTACCTCSLFWTSATPMTCHAGSELPTSNVTSLRLDSAQRIGNHWVRLILLHQKWYRFESTLFHYVQYLNVKYHSLYQNCVLVMFS